MDQGPTAPEFVDHARELTEALVAYTKLVDRQLAQQRDWKLAFRNGLLAGLGGVIGATVVVSLVVAILQPFRSLQAVGPMIERLDTVLKQNNRR